MEKRLRILLVQDNRVDQTAFERFVKREGLPYMYQVAGSVSEAKRALTTGQFDAVLIDCSPDDGVGLGLLEDAGGTPLVVLTQSGDEQVAVQAIRMGADGYLVKDPAGRYLTLLPVTIERAIKHKRDEKELERYREHIKDLVRDRTAEVHLAYEQLQAQVAERKRAEEALADSHEGLLTILDSIDADVYVADIETYEILFMNQHMQANFGPGLVGEICWEVFRGESGPCAHCTNDQLLDSDGHPSGVVTWEGQNPITGRWYLNYDRAIRWTDGRLVRLQVATDITEHSRAEEALREDERRSRRFVETRLALIEYAASHTLDALLTRALDEVGAFVDSPIGFYHFVESDQKTLSLQQWSTRTLQEFCQAEGKGMHYGIDQAGVWVDCVHERKPVIHNDYASLPHKKGMPEGHAAVVRELVVPVIREDKVVAILGVGNKPTEYTEEDVEIVSYLADVTWEIVRQKQAEEALRASERKYRNIIQSIPMGMHMYRLESEGRLVFAGANRAADEILGVENDQFIGQTIEEAFPPLANTEVPERYRLTASNGVPWHTEQITYQDDQIAGAFEVYAFQTSPGRMTAAFWDVTERKRAEEAQMRLATAIEQSAESVVITDAEGTILYVNPAFERVAGYSHEEAVGQNPRILKSGKQDAAFYLDLWATLRSGQVWHGRFVNKRKDGTLYTEDATISPIRDERGEIVNYVAVKRDVTSELGLEERYRQSQKMEAVGRLAGGVAHDFNNLLTAVQGYASLLLDGFASDTRQDWPSGPTIRADLGEILKAGDRASALTQQLLAFSRKQVLQPRVLNLNEVLLGVEQMLRRLIGEDIDLSSILDPALGHIRADPGQIEQVILNLSVNARDAMPLGGRLTFETANVALDEAYARVHPGVEPGRYVRLAVSDTGVGMTEQVKAHLFEPFFTTKEDGKGTGLGLATVWGVVDRSGGHVEVYSELGVGTTFKVYLPRVDEAEGEEGERGLSAKALPRGTETLLLAEDEEAVRRLARRVLEECGYTVLDVKRSEDAVHVSEEHAGPIHLLVTDVVMPGLGGRELAERLAPSRPEMKVLYISGYTDDAIAHHGVLDPGVTLLEKPFAPDGLARKVREVLDA